MGIAESHHYRPKAAKTLHESGRQGTKWMKKFHMMQKADSCRLVRTVFFKRVVWPLMLEVYFKIALPQRLSLGMSRAERMVAVLEEECPEEWAELSSHYGPSQCGHKGEHYGRTDCVPCILHLFEWMEAVDRYKYWQSTRDC